MERFRVNAVPAGDTCRLTISGEADLAVAADIVALGTAALNEPEAQILVVDLGAVTFMDSTGLGSLISLRNVADGLGKRLVIEAIPPRVQRLIDLTGLHEILAVPDHGAA
jgi:anti-anti-sigma factor